MNVTEFILVREGDFVMERNDSLRQKMLSNTDRCELCGYKRNLEVHHIIPLVFSTEELDLDVEDNMIVICQGCHSKLTPRRLLTKKGINVAKSNGKKPGRKTGVKIETKKAMQAKEKIREMYRGFSGTLTAEEVIHLIGISRNTFFKYVKEIKEFEGKHNG